MKIDLVLSGIPVSVLQVGELVGYRFDEVSYVMTVKEARKIALAFLRVADEQDFKQKEGGR